MPSQRFKQSSRCKRSVKARWTPSHPLLLYSGSPGACPVSSSLSVMYHEQCVGLWSLTHPGSIPCHLFLFPSLSISLFLYISPFCVRQVVCCPDPLGAVEADSLCVVEREHCCASSLTWWELSTLYIQVLNILARKSWIEFIRFIAITIIVAE